MGVAGFAPGLGALDALSLALALGPVTERIRLGCVVSPVTMRHPVMAMTGIGGRPHSSLVLVRGQATGDSGVRSIVI